MPPIVSNIEAAPFAASQLFKKSKSAKLSILHRQITDLLPQRAIAKDLQENPNQRKFFTVMDMMKASTLISRKASTI